MQLDIALHLSFMGLIKTALICVYKLLLFYEKDQISIDAVAVLRISYLQMLSLQPEITAVQPSEVKKTFLAITSSLGWLSN